MKVTGSGAEGLELADTYKPDVVILDVGLPDISGFDVCTSLSNSNNAFMLMVSGHSREQDVLLGPGPRRRRLHHQTVLRKRTRRARGVVPAPARKVQPARKKKRAFCKLGTRDAGTRFPHARATTARPSRSPRSSSGCCGSWREAEGRLLTRAQILEHVWNDTSGVPTRVVDVHVAALRKKLTEVGAPLEIASVRGIGYRLDTK